MENFLMDMANMENCLTSFFNGAGEFAVSHTQNVPEFSFSTVSESEIFDAVICRRATISKRVHFQFYSIEMQKKLLYVNFLATSYLKLFSDFESKIETRTQTEFETIYSQKRTVW
jgi:hypothetical protein